MKPAKDVPRRVGRKGWRLAAAAAALGLTGQRLASAATIRSDTPDSDYTALGAESQYASSGYVYVALGMEMGEENVLEGSGTLIAPNWVLTAAHVVTQDTSGFPTYSASQITFGQGATAPYPGTSTVEQVFVEPGFSFNGSGQGNDLALVELSSPVSSVTPATLYPSSLGTLIGQTATIIGYGSTGTGLTGDNSTTYGTRRGIQNTIDAVGGQITTGGAGKQYSFVGDSSNLLLTDFDEPGVASASLMGSSTPLTLEGSSAPGDSGGGLFVTVSGTTYLAGVTDIIGAFANNAISTEPNGYYGDYDGYTSLAVPQSQAFIESAMATQYAWAATGGGNWPTTGDWTSAGVPAAGGTANFDDTITSAATIDLNGSRSVGAIVFNSSNSYTIAAGSGGSLTLNQPGGTAAIYDDAGNHFITAPIVLSTNTEVTVATSGNTLQISGNVSGTGGIFMSGAGTLELKGSNNYSGGTTVSGGVLIVQAAAALPDSVVSVAQGKLQLASGIGQITLPSLSVSNQGVVDITNNSVIINYAGASDPLATYRTLVANGYNNGSWTGTTSITSSTVAASVGGSLTYGIAVADGGDGQGDTGLGSKQLEITAALDGDCNLNGTVDSTDLGIVLGNWQKTGQDWDEGDFNGDGTVDSTDLGELLGNWQGTASLSVSELDSIESVTGHSIVANADGVGFSLVTVPEPATLGLLAMVAAGVLGRRRRRFGVK